MKGKLICLCLAILTAIPHPALGEGKTKVSDLKWMAGHWTATLGGNTVKRSCSEPAGGSMMCMMRVIAGNQVVWLEFSVMRETADGIVLDTRFFTSDGQPSDPISTELRLKSVTGDVALFENPNGTQPKIESITRGAADKMSSHADLVDAQGKTTSMDIAWTRAK